ncbi:F0F1 ATP synthase subunit epsilon [Palleronia sp. LCG004]|uniref:F0F1 ATP synthase subunit epsilon n=1 Tax=Palleronia sp. LCG004 TaxID=3079304 RepID=UPI0029428B4C|nr:F0F1 ATP synthase subunit epsilon [Palleronia sp. LCG004]WOI55072.1 F0F1 ATP synthase subunit epsilon [Palleronia sp. LCG004]
MADTVKFELVSPERRVASMQVSAVRIPATDGDLTAMANHTPLITTLRPGVLHAEGPDGTVEFVVTGGFAEIGVEGISVLAEESHSREEMTQDKLDRMIEEAARKHNEAKGNFENEPGPVDDAAKLLSDMMAMGDHIGLDPKQPNF